MEKPNYFGLYWVEDGDEDWFVLVPLHNERTKNKEEFFGDEYSEIAELFHANYEGYDLDSVQDLFFDYGCVAEFICLVPTKLLSNKDIADSKNDFKLNYKPIIDENLGFMVETLKRFLDNEALGDFDFVDITNVDDVLWKLIEETEGYILNDSDGIMDFCDNHNINYQSFLHAMFHTIYKYAFVDGYAPIHAQNNVLTKIDGMVQIDDGKKSLMRTYIYNGRLFSEGDMEARIGDIRKKYR